eukprot:6188090-Pleurochrysis_carterae.AAC.2
MAEAAKAWLLQANDTGVSVYGHLTEVLAHMLNTQPTDAVDALEITSHQVKQSYFTKDSAIPPPAPTAAPDADSATSWQQSNSALLKAKAGDEEEEEANEDLRITNLLDDLALIEWSAFILAYMGACMEHNPRAFSATSSLHCCYRIVAPFLCPLRGAGRDRAICRRGVQSALINLQTSAEQEACDCALLWQGGLHPTSVTARSALSTPRRYSLPYLGLQRTTTSWRQNTLRSQVHRLQMTHRMEFMRNPVTR